MTLTRPMRRALAVLAAGQMLASQAVLRQLWRRGLALPADPEGVSWTLMPEGQAMAQEVPA